MEEPTISKNGRTIRKLKNVKAIIFRYLQTVNFHLIALEPATANKIFVTID